MCSASSTQMIIAATVTRVAAAPTTLVMLPRRGSPSGRCRPGDCPVRSAEGLPRADSSAIFPDLFRHLAILVSYSRGWSEAGGGSKGGHWVYPHRVTVVT